MRSRTNGASPLSIVLDAARWLAAAFASAGRRHLRMRYAELRAHSSVDIDAQRFFSYVLSGGQAPLDALARGG